MTTRIDTSGSSSYSIYTGFWIDWSHGRILGSTITLSNRNGALLIAFLALFVSFVGTSIWRITCYGLHHLYSREAAQDGLYHQRQAILRNSANGTSGAWGLMQILRAWTGERATHHSYQRVLPVLGLAVCCICVAGAAGTYSARITTAMGNQVLLASTNCTKMTYHDNQDEANYIVVRKAVEHGMQWNSWAERCYTNSNPYGNCKQFIKDRLQSTIYRNATCPFPGEICQTTNSSGSIVLDSGFLDSHWDLGINAPEDERILYREVSACAPLLTEPYQRQGFTDGGVGITAYYYGNTSTTEYTMYYPTLNVTDIERNGMNVHSSDYTINTVVAYASEEKHTNKFSTFAPIPELQVPNADVTITFLSSNAILFLEEVNDPWYSAHVDSGRIHLEEHKTKSTKFADNAASPLGCATQYQICNPSLPKSSRCTPLSGNLDIYDRSLKLWKENKHLNMVAAFEDIIFNANPVPEIVEILGIAGLTARHSKINVVQGALPDDQWQQELEQWFATSLVSLQAAAVTTATQFRDPGLAPFLTPFSSSEGKKMCRNIKVYDSAYWNFSVFGLCFTLVVGSIIVIFSFTLEWVVSWIQRKRNYDTYARIEWSSNEVLQLQRMAHEELGLGPWHGCVDAVPVPARGDRLATLDVSDKKHPILKVPPPTFEDLLTEPAVVAAEAGVNSKSQPSSQSTELKSATENQQTQNAQEREEGEVPNGSHEVDRCQHFAEHENTRALVSEYLSGSSQRD